jgi:hypothetical protein
VTRSQYKAIAALLSVPILPPSWAVTSWCIDGQNSSACASDSNDGLSCVCSGSGRGPLRTVQELQIHRWGCTNGALACPRLGVSSVNATFTVSFLSSSVAGDVFYFTPATENGATPILLGTMSPICSGALAGVIPKSRGSHQLLTATLCSGTIQDAVVVNATTNSRARVFAAVGGGAWALSQPLAPIAVPWNGSDPHEDDTWSNGQLYTVYAIPAVLVARVTSATADLNTNSVAYIEDIDLVGPSASSVVLLENIALLESTADRYVQLMSVGAVPESFAINSVSNLAITGAASPANFSEPAWKGGIIRQSFSSAFSITLEGGVILSGAGAIDFNGQVNDVDIESGATLYMRGEGFAGTYPGQAHAFVWGAGTMDVDAPASLFVNSASATTSMLVSTLQLNGLSTACSASNTSSPTMTCALPVTAASLDAHGGALFSPTGASITTTTSPF